MVVTLKPVWGAVSNPRDLQIPLESFRRRFQAKESFRKFQKYRTLTLILKETTGGEFRVYRASIRLL